MIDDLSGIIDSLPVEDAIQIDIERIDDDSIKGAESIINDIVTLYHDKDWIDAHPQYKNRINIELETLRGLLKMRQADEQAHDALLKGISMNNSNASLYRALAEIQKTSLAVTKQINESIAALTEIVKIFQMDAEATEEDSDEDVPKKKNDTPKNTHRGSKDFIKEMNSDQG